MTERAATLRWPGVIVVILLVLTACSSAGVEKDSEPRHVDDTIGVDNSSGQTATDDLRAARSYFSGFSPDPEGAVLPESARANELLGECLAIFGFAVKYAGAGGVFTESGDAQHGRRVAVTDACMEAMHEQGLISLGDDPDTMRLRYEAYMEAYECLLAMGVTADPPPSLEAFLDGEPWSPFDNLGVFVSSEGDLNGPSVDCGIP